MLIPRVRARRQPARPGRCRDIRPLRDDTAAGLRTIAHAAPLRCGSIATGPRRAIRRAATPSAIIVIPATAASCATALQATGLIVRENDARYDHSCSTFAPAQVVIHG
jgi:hypothetical protein